MSISTFLGLETALRGLLAQQRQLDVTAHNIANANTPGYTRQTARLETSEPLRTTDGALGTGVDVVDYTRIRDQFLDVQLRAQTTLQGKYEAQQDVLQQVELVVNEPTDTGLSTLLSKFWSSWQDVANAPEDPATRQALIQSGKALAGGISGLAGQLGVIADQTDENVAQTVDDVNATVGSIVDLNTQIGTAVAAGQQPSSDLLDRRDVLLDKLGTLVNLRVTKNTDVDGKDLGTVSLSIDDSSAVPSSAPLLDATNTQVLLVAGSLPASLTAGKLGGLVAAQADIAGYRTSLDTFASDLATAVNTVLKTVAPTNVFFTDPPAGAAGIAVVAVAATLQVSSSAGAPGNADLALAVADLRGGGADGDYIGLVTRIGSDSQDIQRKAANAKVLADALLNRRESISGVSLDEEMTNLVRFQRAYQAAARALTAMDDMVDFLVQRTGKVGL